MSAVISPHKTLHRGSLRLFLALFLLAGTPAMAVAAVTITWDPLYVDFGQVPIGTTATQHLTLTNAEGSTDALTISSIEFTFNQASAFNKSHSMLPAVLDAGVSLDVVLTFTPNDFSFAMADLLITNTSDNAPSLALSMLGSGEFAATPGDLNGDDVVDRTDQKVLHSSLGRCNGEPGFISDTDYNGSGCTDLDDYRIWVGFYRDSNPPQPCDDCTRSSRSLFFLGAWVGSYSSSLLKETPLLLELRQIGHSVSGTFEDLAGGYGTISVGITGSDFDFTMTSSDPDCPGTFAGMGSIVGNSLSFTYNGTNCLGDHNNGVGNATRQVGTVLAYGQQRPSNLRNYGSDLYWRDISEEPIKKMPVTGGTPLALTRYIGVPVGMTIQGSDMYWIAFRSDGQVLNKSSLDGSVTEKLATGEHYAHDNANVVVDNENAYWVTSRVSPNEYSIQKVPLNGSPPTTITTTSFQPIDTMVRDASYLYWAEGRFPDPGVIKRIPLAGGAIEEIYTVANGITGNLIIVGSNLIVAEIVYPYPYNYRLLKIPVGGGSATVLTTLAQDPVPFKMATDATTIYWFDGAGVFSMPSSSGSVTQLASISTSAFDLAVDSSSVIWLEKGGSAAGTIYEVPLGGGSQSTLATDLFTPYGGALAIGANRIFIAEGDPNITWYGRIAQVPRSGGAVTPFVTGITASNDPMVTDGTNVYAVDGWRILKIPSGGGPSETLTRSDFYIEDLVTDGTYVYWLEGGPFRPIKRIHVTGGPVDTLTTISEFVEMLEVDDTYLYWVEGINTMKKMPSGGGPITTIASVGDVSDLISDGNYVYYSMKGSGSIQRVSVNGGPVETVTSEAMYGSLWRALAVDASNVYWIDEGRVGKVPKTGGSAMFIVSGGMQTGTQPSTIAVDATRVYWTESDGGTIKRAAK
jgi:hypothetical protein